MTWPARKVRPLMSARGGVPWKTPLMRALATHERKAGVAAAAESVTLDAAVVAVMPGASCEVEVTGGGVLAAADEDGGGLEARPLDGSSPSTIASTRSCPLARRAATASCALAIAWPGRAAIWFRDSEGVTALGADDFVTTGGGGGSSRRRKK